MFEGLEREHPTTRWHPPKPYLIQINTLFNEYQEQRDTHWRSHRNREEYHWILRAVWARYRCLKQAKAYPCRLSWQPRFWIQRTCQWVLGWLLEVAKWVLRRNSPRGSSWEAISTLFMETVLRLQGWRSAIQWETWPPHQLLSTQWKISVLKSPSEGSSREPSSGNG
jgi:hypothetical protein